MPGGRRALIIVAVVLVVIAGVGFLLLGRDGDDGDPTPSTTTERPEDPRAGPCDRLSTKAVDEAMGGPSTVAAVDDLRCSIAREGTLLSVEVEQTDGEADETDLDAAERSSGPDPEHLEPWPEETVDEVGDDAVWIADPASDGSFGELYVLSGKRLIRISVSTPPDYRREARAIAIAIAEPVLARL